MQAPVMAIMVGRVSAKGEFGMEKAGQVGGAGVAGGDELVLRVLVLQLPHLSAHCLNGTLTTVPPAWHAKPLDPQPGA